MKTGFLLKKTCFFVTLAVLYNGSAFKIFDAEPLIRGSPVVNLTADEMEEVLNLDTGGEYTTMSFQYEHDQYLGQFDNKRERCYNDHVRCLTSILSSSRPVCGVRNWDGWSAWHEGTAFGSLCDLYLDNCRRNSSGKDLWQVLDSGSCERARKIHVYGYADNISPVPEVPGR